MLHILFYIFGFYIGSFNQSRISFCSFMASVMERSNFTIFHIERQAHNLFLKIYFFPTDFYNILKAWFYI